MVLLRKDHKLVVAMKDNSNIRCNLDMKVITSNEKKVGTREKNVFNILKWCTLIIVIITIIGLYENVKNFQIQINNLNYSIVQLTRQYNELSENINNCKCRHKIRHYYGFLNMDKYSDYGLSLSKVTEKGSSDVNQVTLSIRNQSINDQDVAIQRNYSTDLSHITTSPRNLHISDVENLVTAKDKKIDADVLNSQNETGMIRLRRNSINSTEKPRKKKPCRRHCKAYLTDPQIVTFIGAIPEQRIHHGVAIGPWRKNNRVSNPFDFTKFNLTDDGKSIKVNTNGLYMISVQIFYYGESQKFSYFVIIDSKYMSNMKNKKLVICATSAPNVTGETTCHTSLITYLHKGDKLKILQNENDRFINLREGYSYIQLVMLAEYNNKTQETTRLQV